MFSVSVVSANGDLEGNTALSGSFDSVDQTTIVSASDMGGAVVDSPIVNESTIENNVDNVNVNDNVSFSRDNAGDSAVLGSSSDNDDILNDENNCFSALKSLIDATPVGGTLLLERSYTYDTNYDTALLDGIIINKAITIDGQGRWGVTGNANYGVRLFRVQAANVVFQNMTFTNGYRLRGATNGHHGGAIWYNTASKNALVINCNFSNNRAFEADDYTSYGGSIYWQGRDGFNVINCIFRGANNYAARYGGGIFTEGSNVLVTNSTFVNLRTEDCHGGAFYGSSASYTNLTITNCKFENMSATACFSALYTAHSRDVTIYNNTFSNWYARYGMMHVRGGYNINISYNTFKGYNAYCEAGIRLWEVFSDNIYIGYNKFENIGNGGAYRLIALYAGSANATSGCATIEYNNFTNINLASSAATAAAIDVLCLFTRIDIRNNIFTNITSRAYGVIRTLAPTYIENNTFTNYYLSAADGTASVLRGMAISSFNYTYIKNNTFVGGSYNASRMPNSAEGVIYIDDIGTGYIVNNTFINNNFTASTLLHMGVISNHGNDTIIKDNYFYDANCTGGLGGFIYNTGSNVEIYNNNFTNASAKNGGTIYSTGENVVISNNNVTHIYADEAGGFYIIGKNTEVSENYFDNITAINYGVMYCDAEGSVFSKNNYTNNHAVTQGVFAIGSGVTLNNESFINNNVSNGLAGTILLIGNNNALNDVNITNTRANTGGAIYNTGNNNKLNRVNITNTSAVSGYGGAVYSIGNFLDINGLYVENSNATIDGGAVYNSGSDGKIANSVFKNVNASNNGGTIFWTGAAGTLDNVNISNSFAGGDGGAIYWSGSDGKLNRVNATNIHAVTGGAVYCSGSNSNLTNSFFNNIRATSDGGAIYWTGNVANLTSIIFSNINSSANGGAIYGTGIDSFIGDLSFDNVNASGSGGAIYWTGARSVLNNLDFINIISYAKGGALYFTGEESKFIKGRFYNTHSVDNGGAIYWTGSSGNLTGVTFIECTSEDMGGAIYWTGTNSNVSHSVFIDNHASSGGAVYWAADSGKLLYSNFTNNVVDANGGAVYWIGNNAEFYKLNLSNNIALFKGGAINIIGNNNKFDSIYAANNDATVDGGAIVLDGSKCVLTNSNFVNNHAITNGGALYWSGINGTLTNSNFTNNHGGIGGAVYWGADNANISTVNFKDNNASTAGALYMGGLSGGKLVNGNFTNNNATSIAGAVYWTGSKGNLTDCSFNGANARDGGAVYWAGNDAVLDNLDLVNVYARENGGMLYVTSSNVTVSNSEFYGSKAISGGAIYWTGSDGALKNDVFANNSASNYGGAVYWIGNDAKVNNVNFTNNSAGIDGGALYMISYGAMLDNVKFFNNSAANYGGGLYWAGTGNISNFEFKYNRAVSGSAIYNSGTLNLKSGSVLRNKANISSFDIIESETNIEMSITTVVHGLDNFLNGIWTTSANIQVYDVTYYGASGEVSTAARWIKPRNGYSDTVLFYDTRLAGVPVNVTLRRSGADALSYGGVTNLGGNFTHTVTKIPSGDYDAVVVHIDDDYYFGKEYTEVVNVGIIIPDLEVSLNTTEFYYDTSVLIRAKVIAVDGEGKAITVWGKSDIYVDDIHINLTLDVADGLAEYACVLPPEFGIGIHNITGNFYDGVDKDGNPVDDINRSDAFYFTIVKNFLPTVMNITISSPVVYVGDEVNITIKGPSAYKGDVIYVAGNVNGTAKLDENGFINITTSYPYNGTVNVLVYVGGDDNYLPSSASYSFDVIRKNFTLTLNNLDAVNVGDTVIINATLNESDVSGSIIISVDGKNYGALINGYNAVAYIDGLSKGVHNITASYKGDAKYNPISGVSKSLTVNKVDISTISVVADNPVISVGDSVVLTVNVNSTNTSKYPVNGYVIVNIDGSNYNLYINNNVGSLTVYNLTNATHDVKVIYDGDDQFNAKTVTVDDVVAVNKIDTRVAVTPVNPSIIVGDYVLFDISVIPDKYIVNDHVIVKVGNTVYDVPIVNNKGLLNVSNLKYSADAYLVNVTYEGNDQFNKANFTTSVVVNKDVISSINVRVDNDIIYVGDDVLLNITVRSGKFNLDGIVTLTIDGVNYNVSVSDGKGYLKVSNLPYKGEDYIVDVYFPGNDQFGEFIEPSAAAFNVKKVDINDIVLDVVTSPIIVGEDAVMNINISSKVPDKYLVNGFVTVVIDNREYNVSVIDGIGHLTVSGLTSGDYPIYVNYDGDDTFNRFNRYSSTSINHVVVDKVPTSLSMEDVEISVGNVAVIVARVNNTEVTGNIVFIVDGKEYSSGIVDGVGVVNVYGLNTSANSTITAKYSGDAKFMNSSATATLTVNKVSDSVSISVYDITAGENEVVIITLPADLSNGTIEVKFNGSVLTPNKYSINNNVITFNRTIQNAGVYDVEVSVKDDAKYNNMDASDSFTVSSSDNYNIAVTVDDVVLGQSAKIKVVLPSDAVSGTVFIDGVGYTVREASRGITLPNADNAGVVNVNVTYVGDPKYSDNTVIVNYTVLKAPSKVSIDIDNVFYVGDNIPFTVIAVNSTGIISVSINDKVYNPAKNTRFVINDLLPASDYTVVVKLAGDDNYDGADTSKVIHIIKKDVSVVLQDISTPVNVNDNVLITVNFNESVNGSVIFNINGSNYTVDVVDANSASYTYTPLFNGNYSVSVTYSGNDKFNSNSSSTSRFTANKIATNLVVSADPIYVGQDALINVEVSNGATGTVDVSINNKKYVVVLDSSGKGSVHVSGLTNTTNNNIVAVYNGNNIYGSSNASSSVVVNKVDIRSIDIVPADQSIYVGKDAELDITIDPSIAGYIVDGYVTVNVNDSYYNVSIKDNKGSLTVPGLAYGDYSVSVAYAGDYMYNPKSASNAAKITVNKVDIRSITVIPDTQSIYVGTDAELNIIMDASVAGYTVDGYVTVKVNNTSYNVSIANGFGSINVSALKGGDYTVDVIFAGNSIYNAKTLSDAATIKVKKIPISISMAPITQSIYVGETANLNINVNADVAGFLFSEQVIVKVNNTEYKVHIINGTGFLSVTGLLNGTYDVSINYNGSDVYENASYAKTKSIMVNKIPTSIVVDNVNINVGDVATIIATISNSTVTGNVTFIVDNKEYNAGIIDGVARVNVTNLNTSANKTITAKYSGDYKFINSTGTALLTVTKVYGNASIIVHNITAGETETVLIKLPKDTSNGTITVKFNNNPVTDYTISNNVISFNRTLQASGNYTVSISVNDDCKYYDFSNSTVFTVVKVKPENYTISINVNNTYVFEDIPVVINFPNDANGTLSLSVDNVPINAVIPVVDGVATYTLDNMSFGNHTITVTFENEKYDTKTVSTNVYVAKIASSINVTAPEDAKVAHDIIITVSPEARATGIVTADINGKTYIVEDRTIINASDLLEGEYTVVVKLAEDDNFLESTNHTVFIVTRNDVSLVLNNITGEVRVDHPVVFHVDLTANVTGSVIFNINDVNYTVNITESDFAEFTWTPAKDGVVEVSASYLGNDTYYPNSTNTIVFDVYRNPIVFDNISVYDIMVDDIEHIIVSLNESDATGIIVINVNGSEYDSRIIDGRAVFDVSGLVAGTYNVIAFYGGDVKYLATNAISGAFNVSKYDAPMSIVAEDIMVLDDAKITVNVLDKATGHISITVDGQSIYLPIVDGSVSWTISGLSAGVYEVNALYSGDYKYLSNSSIANFTVHRYNSTFNISHDENGWTGDDIHMSVKLSDDATGNVTLSINGTDYILPVTDGAVDFTIPALDAGDYEVVISYPGDYKYSDVSDAFNFTVISNHPILSSESVVKYYKGPERLYVNLTNVRGDKLAGETLYITVNGITYSRVTNADGVCSLPINLPSGEYEVSIVYNTSELYDPIEYTVNATVLSTVVGEDLVKVFCNDSQYWARFTDSEGNPLAKTSVTFNINGVFYSRVTNSDGWAKLNINLPAGEYIITAYNPLTDEAHSNLIKVLPRIVENSDLVKVYRGPEKYTVRIIGNDTLPVGEGVPVNFNINGVLYSRNTNASGYASLNINLPAGEYIITASYAGCTVSNTITVLDVQRDI